MQLTTLAVVLATLVPISLAHPFDLLSLLGTKQGGGGSTNQTSGGGGGGGNQTSGQCSASLMHTGPPTNLSQVTPNMTFIDALKTNSSFSIFTEVLQMANLTQQLNQSSGGGGGGGSSQQTITIFAPTDAAFGSLPQWVRASFEQNRQETMDVVKALIHYHIVDRAISSSEFTSPKGGAGGGGGAASTTSIASAFQILQQQQATPTSTSTGGGSGGSSSGGLACTQQEQQQQRQQIQQRLLSLNLAQLTREPTRLANLSVFIGNGQQSQQQGGGGGGGGQQSGGQKQQQQPGGGGQQTWEVNQAQIVSFGNSSNAVIYGINQVLTPLIYLKNNIYLLQESPSSSSNTSSSGGR